MLTSPRISAWLGRQADLSPRPDLAIPICASPCDIVDASLLLKTRINQLCPHGFGEWQQLTRDGQAIFLQSHAYITDLPVSSIKDSNSVVI